MASSKPLNKPRDAKNADAVREKFYRKYPQLKRAGDKK